MADDEYSVPGDVVEGVGGRTYSGGTFSGILPHPWPKRRPSTYSTASRSSQVTPTAINDTRGSSQNQGRPISGFNTLTKDVKSL